MEKPKDEPMRPVLDIAMSLFLLLFLVVIPSSSTCTTSRFSHFSMGFILPSSNNIISKQRRAIHAMETSSSKELSTVRRRVVLGAEKKTSKDDDIEDFLAQYQVRSHWRMANLHYLMVMG